MLLEALISLILLEVTVIGFLQLCSKVLRHERELVWMQRAQIILKSLQEDVGAEQELMQYANKYLPQGRINFNQDHWRVQWSGGVLE